MAGLTQFELPTVDLLPARGAVGYAPGTMIYKRTFPQGVYVNHGTAAQCQFVPMTQDPAEYAIINAGYFPLTNGQTTLAPTVASDALRFNADAITFAGYGVSDDTDQLFKWGITARDTITAAYTDPLSAHGLNYFIAQKGGVPKFDIIFAGQHTTVGGDATEPITLAGAKATDLAFVNMHTTGGTARLIQDATMTANTLTVELAGDPNTGTAHVINYVVLRERGVSQPSHCIYKTGSYSCVTADSATMSITDADVLTTDVLLCVPTTSAGTAPYVKDVRCATNGTITLVASADPGTDGTTVFRYFVIRPLSAGIN